MFLDIPNCQNLRPVTQAALQNVASDIYQQYVVGNKSSARAMMNNVPHKRRLYVAMCFAVCAEAAGDKRDYYEFVNSLTE